MADQIGVEIVAADQQYVASLQKAAAGTAALAAQEERLGKIAEEIGLDKGKFSRQFAKVESERLRDAAKQQRDKDTADKRAASAAAKKFKDDEKDKLRAAKKAADDRAKAEKKAAADIASAESKRTSLNQKLARIILGRKALIIGEASGIGKIGVATVELGGALLTATVAAGTLLATIGAIAVKTAQTRDNTKEWFDILTGGRGKETLDLVDGLAGDLGIKFGVAREQFEKFRQAGLDNTQSANLIKLAADLDSVDRSGKKSEEAIARVLSYASNGYQTKEQIQAADRAMALLAKQAGVAGDGTNAAADAAKSLSGAWDRIDNTKTKALEQLGDKITPGLERAAQAISKIVEDFYKSKDGQEIIEQTAKSINKMADAAERAAPYVRDLVKADNIRKGASALGELESAAEEVVSAAWEIPKAFWIVANNTNDAVNYIATPFEDVGIKIAKTAADWAVRAVRWGSDIIDGIVSGISSGFTKAEKVVTDLGHRISNAFTGKLEIHSPSRLFERHGENTGKGYTQGVERSMPTGEEIAERVTPSHSVFGGQQPIFGRSLPASSGTVVHVTIENITVPAGEDAGKWMRAAGHELGLGIQAALLSQGAPLQ